MKRNRAEPAPQTPARTPRRYAGTNANQKLPQQLHQKPQSREAEEKRPPPGNSPCAPSSSSSSSSSAAAAAAAAAAEREIEWAPQAGWDPVGELAGTWSTWGVAEETLLGWFPFADEHFHGAGAFWEEESYCCCSYCYYHDDIWHLHHIHEAPNKKNRD